MDRVLSTKKQAALAYDALHPVQFFRNLSTDVILTAIGVAVLMAYGFYLGKEKLVSLLVSLYLGTLLFSLFPFLANVTLFKENATQVAISHIIIFAIFVLGSEFILRKIISPGFSFSRVRGWMDIGLLSAANIGSLIVIGYKLLSFDAFYQPTLISISVLASSVTFFWTVIVSLVVLYFASK